MYSPPLSSSRPEGSFSSAPLTMRQPPMDGDGSSSRISPGEGSPAGSSARRLPGDAPLSSRNDAPMKNPPVRRPLASFAAGE
jgi:hypothetical protein